MTTIEAEVMKLPKLQKVSLMERIWADFCQEENSFEPPEWHALELEETERLLEEGKEHFEDWSDAKKRLREL
ncbi:MAG: addiction module protein [Kiritimatiellia bacterium]